MSIEGPQGWGIITSRGAFFRLQYELEDALARCDDLAAENARLHAEIAKLRICDDWAEQSASAMQGGPARLAICG